MAMFMRLLKKRCSFVHGKQPNSHFQATTPLTPSPVYGHQQQLFRLLQSRPVIPYAPSRGGYGQQLCPGGYGQQLCPPVWTQRRHQSYLHDPSDEKKFVCRICPPKTRFRKPADLRDHFVKEHEKITESGVACVCGNYFYLPCQMEKHKPTCVLREDETYEKFKQRVAEELKKRERLREKKEAREAKNKATLLLGNLAKKVRQTHVKQFFKPFGKIVKIHFFRKGSRKGSVEFDNAEQATKALQQMNGEKLLQNAVRLERVWWGPQPKVYVNGFDPVDGEEKIRSSLMDHFSKCGEIAKISIHRHHNGEPTKFAFVQFLDDGSCNKALELNDTPFGNGLLMVKEALPKRWRLMMKEALTKRKGKRQQAVKK